MSGAFRYRGSELVGEAVALADVARSFGTPCYVYSRAALESAYCEFADTLAASSFGGLVCYAVKANSNLGVLSLLARRGAGFDIVSGGELQRVLRAGGSADRVVFAGVGKSADEIARGLEAGIRCFNVESPAELRRISGVAAEAGRTAAVALRVNPDVTADTHPHIATGASDHKFGIPAAQVPEMARLAGELPGVRLDGLAAHIGSQIVDLAPFGAIVDRLVALARELAAGGVALRHLDFGGGLGIGPAAPPRPDYVRRLLRHCEGAPVRELIIEPGRSVAGEAGVLLTRVELIKHSEQRSFAVVDAGMNDLLRPALYGARHPIWPVHAERGLPTARYHVVGPVCETADRFAAAVPLAIRAGSLLAVMEAGAYGFSMSSTYNSRPRPAELVIDGGDVHSVRARESTEDLFRGEHVPAVLGSGAGDGA